MSKILKTPLWALLVLAVSFSLSSCKDDDEDEIEILSPVAGQFVGAETCGPNPPAEYYIHVYNSSDDKNKVYVENIYGISDFAGLHVGFPANVSGNTITMPDTDQQVITADQDTFNIRVGADGTVNGDVLTLNFRISGDLGDDACKFVGSRTYIGQAF